ncbi:MAG: RpiB/LacA/LacB family sugar-phosphate isomerase [Phycisphaerae bacterium]|nr:RpiB/LacA/LacB family sugar-phosphate isomerase [Phycisphaerae bacterium]
MARELITATTLERLAQAGQPIVVSRDALITPAAQDWMRHTNVPVSYQEDGGGIDVAYGIAAEFEQPMIRSTAAAIEDVAGPYRRFEMPSSRGQESLATAIELCGAIATGEIERGIVLHAHPGTVCILANKLPDVRAMIGTCWRAAESACRAVGLNVLALQPGVQSYHEIKQIASKFLKAERRSLPAIEAAILAAERKRLGADR